MGGGEARGMRVYVCMYVSVCVCMYVFMSIRLPISGTTHHVSQEEGRRSEEPFR